MKRLAVATALGAGLLIAGCGSAATSIGAGTGTPTATAPSASTPVPTAAQPVAMRCNVGRVMVPVGRVIAVQDCPAGVLTSATSTVLAAVGSDRFRAVRAGSALIELSAGPSCSAGTLCPQYRRYIGAITVTVTAA